MMAEIARIYHDTRESPFYRESAEIYFSSYTFTDHCFLLGLDEKLTRRILKSSQPKGKQIKLPVDE